MIKLRRCAGLSRFLLFAHCKCVIGLDKSGYQVIIFLISPRKHILWYSLEAPHLGASNEYHNIYFYGEIRKYRYFWTDKKHLIKGYMACGPKRLSKLFTKDVKLLSNAFTMCSKGTEYTWLIGWQLLWLPVSFPSPTSPVVNSKSTENAPRLPSTQLKMERIRSTSEQIISF